MRYHCTAATDRDELVGHEESNGYCYGPLSAAMRNGDELILEGSRSLSQLMLLKLQLLMGGIFIAETGEQIAAAPCFRMFLH